MNAIPEADGLAAEVRRLSTGGGHTFEELLAAGKAGGGTPYTFEELYAIGYSEAPPTVPPLVFVHVPKTAGTTLNHVLARNYRWRLDAYGDSFFPRYYPDEFVTLVQPPNGDDTRRPVFFTGHIKLTNDIFRYMPGRYVSTTVLRQPVERAISQYRFRGTLTGSPLAEEIKSGKISPAQFMEQDRIRYPFQYEIFGRTVDEAIENLERKVSYFGINSMLNLYLKNLQTLVGLPDISYGRLNVTKSDIPEPSEAQQAELRAYLKDDVDFFRQAIAIHARRAVLLQKQVPQHPWAHAFQSNVVRVQFEARQWDGSESQALDLHRWAARGIGFTDGSGNELAVGVYQDHGEPSGWNANPTDWIISGPAGLFVMDDREFRRRYGTPPALHPWRKAYA